MRACGSFLLNLKDAYLHFSVCHSDHDSLCFFLQGPSVSVCDNVFRLFYYPGNLHARIEGSNGLLLPPRGDSVFFFADDWFIAA